jgi:RNA recognition motif-containing protein
LHKLFSDCGEVKSLKVSLNRDFSSRGYGFICFKDKEGAEKALKSNKEDFEVRPFLPKT